MEYKDKYVGIKIYGYCNGFFGRDSYEDKVIIASGDGWIVAKEIGNYSRDDGYEFATFSEDENMEEWIGKWNRRED